MGDSVGVPDDEYHRFVRVVDERLHFKERLGFDDAITLAFQKAGKSGTNCFVSLYYQDSNYLIRTDAL
jgi:hypothetical protein